MFLLSLKPLIGIARPLWKALHSRKADTQHSFHIVLYWNNTYMLNKNTPGVKKVRGQSEAALQIGMCNQKL